MKHILKLGGKSVSVEEANGMAYLEIEGFNGEVITVELEKTQLSDLIGVMLHVQSKLKNKSYGGR